jgi:hypothetical protein
VTPRWLPLALVAAALSGCSGGESGGKATLWITRDEGARVLLVREVPAGLTAMQALDRAAEVKTRYAGRFVQAINGVEGSLADRRDWFYFINGYEADRSAAEYRLHRGDVEWWDYRSWKTRMREPVVVGAFPEPFLHGYNGKRRDAYVVLDGPRSLPAGRRLARVVHAQVVDVSFRPPAGANVLHARVGAPRRFVARLRHSGAVWFEFTGDIGSLAREPQQFRFRYQVTP